MDNIRDNNSDIFSAFVLQADGNIVGLVVIQPGETLNAFFGIPAYFITVLECF